MKELNLFFSKVKELGFWQRLFSWSRVKKLLYNASEEFRIFEIKYNEQEKEIEYLKSKVVKIETENIGLEKGMHETKVQLQTKDAKVEELNRRITELNDKVSRFESIEEKRTSDYEQNISKLTQARDDFDADRNRLNDDRLKEKQAEFERMKMKWSEHEKDIEQHIRKICREQMITYVEDYPHRGKPDNAIEICGEYIVFDAKSPANENLENFPKYIKDQTKSVEKYAKQKSVRKDIFLVVPSNTIENISQYSYNMGDYNVYIITKDSVEPLILTLKRIEEYEFAEQLSPEERDNICRIIGKFTHTTKRRIQIDQFFANQFIDLLVKCGNDLPDDIKSSVIEYEKAEVLNPTTEKRNKSILIEDLKEKNESINAEAQHRKIEIPGSFEDVKKLK